MDTGAYHILPSAVIGFLSIVKFISRYKIRVRDCITIIIHINAFYKINTPIIGIFKSIPYIASSSISITSINLPQILIHIT